MIGFIHITKTGGTDIKDKNKNKEIVYGGYHREDGKFYENKGIPSFAIIRDPIDRFISLFVYNVNGSNKYFKRFNINDINLFINKMREDEKFLNNFEHGWQFKRQTDWLNGKNIYLLKYVKNNVPIIKEFLRKEFGINYIYDVYGDAKKINVTNYRANINVDISEDNKKFINEFYGADVILYEKLIKSNLNYIKLDDFN